MPREKKLIEIAVVQDEQSGESISIGYDPNPGRNYHVAAYQEERFTHQDADEVKKWARQMLAASRDVAWQPVIEVVSLEASEYVGHDAIGLRVERYYLAKRVDGRWIKGGWKSDGTVQPYSGKAGLADDFEIGQEPKPRHYYTYTGRATYYLHYTPELWEALCKLVDGIKAARARLDELIGTPEGRLRLQEVGTSLLLALPAPAHSEEEQAAAATEQ